ncbi:DUF4412 domain-containing protein [Myxococcus sp. RHSTA-1-4]|uniref:LolA family protein n=1 Tax=Myxococcus sp. RHSTA-1-4 TaxID=2874601 RepID=UPI001CBEB58C|nr:DUF4412 domain-containing protein [Myxococcus sp. RHSTA-1-4]MBZ4423181.1 DUF4412 domain-containing protein [Myxococcus sp. RHSTA-1-4]
MSPSSLRHRLSGLAAATLLVATPAFADWSADATTKITPASGQKAPPEVTGKVYGRKGLLRMDTHTTGQPGAVQMSIIFDFEKRTGTTLMHAQKIASERNLDDLPVKLPGSCTGKMQDFDACFLEQGYKKTGTEKVNGHPTTVYEGTPPGMDGKPMRQKVWRPTDLSDVPYVRAQTFGAGGQVTEINLNNVQQGPQPDSRFTVPADYRKMAAPPAGAVPGGFTAEDFQGKSPEQIQEMIRQRMGQGAPKGGGKKP